MKKNDWLKIGVLIAFIAVVTVNYLAVALPIGGLTTGELSDLYPNLFTPEGITFSIWGLIYTTLGVYVIYQFLVKSKKQNEILSRVNGWLLINFLANIAWIFAWHYQIVWLSLVIMVALLVTLIKIADIINTKKAKEEFRWWVRFPFSIYFGWITVATIANVSVFLVDLNWDGFGIAPEVWTVIVLLVGATIGIWRAKKDQNIFYILVFVWAYIGIMLRHYSVNGFNGQYESVIVTLFVCQILFGVTVYGLLRGSCSECLGACPKK